MDIWNLGTLIAIARADDCETIPALLRGAQQYAAREATRAQWESAADVARDPVVAARMRRWAATR